jgi:hypothetical protein
MVSSVANQLLLSYLSPARSGLIARGRRIDTRMENPAGNS